MRESTASYIESAERLCSTLERIGDALVDLDTATLLQTEETLGQLMVVLSSCDSPQEAAALEPLTRRARAAVLRCRRLGAAYAGVAKVRLQMCVGSGRYDRDGDTVSDVVPHSLNITT